MLTRRGFLVVGVFWGICPGMAAPVPVPVPITVSPSDGVQQAGIKQVCTCDSQHEFPKEFHCKTSELTIFEILQSGNFTKCPYFFKFEKPKPRHIPAPTTDSPSRPVPSTFTPTEDDTNEDQRHHWPVVIYSKTIIVCFSVFVFVIVLQVIIRADFCCAFKWLELFHQNT